MTYSNTVTKDFTDTIHEAIQEPNNQAKPMKNPIYQEVKDLGITEYLTRQQHKSLLRILTCGSVDDGKSTLIGRLLHDSHQIYDDQLKSLHKDNEKVGNAGEALDLALLVDGLQAEREQGITIDVAYRYFSTAKRKFIIADTPGHEQYTRNMVTGASTSDVAIILIDARHGVQVQTKRHSFLCHSLGIKHFVVAINKMDMVDFSADVFEQIKADYSKFAAQLNLPNIHFIPLSALKGDNVIHPSKHTPYYQGQSLIECLEDLSVNDDLSHSEPRFSVQSVVRPNLDFRGFQGTVLSGVLQVGDPIRVMPSGKTSQIQSIVTFNGELARAEKGQAVTLTLKDEIDVSRGDVITLQDSQAKNAKEIQAKLVWMDENPLVIGQEYRIKVASKLTSARVTSIRHTIDVNTFEHHEAQQLQLNDIAIVTLELSEPMLIDVYREYRQTGAFILIDRLSNLTVAAGMVEQLVDSSNLSNEPASSVSEFEKELNTLVRKHFPHWNCLDITKPAWS